MSVCESVITYEPKASIPLIAMMYILHRQMNRKFLPLSDFGCELRHSKLNFEGRAIHFSGRKWCTGLTPLVYDGVSTITSILSELVDMANFIMYIVFQIRFNRLQWCNGYLTSLPCWQPRFDSRGRKYFSSSYFSHLFLYILQKSLVAFYIKLNALGKSSHQPLFMNVQIHTHYHSYDYMVLKTNDTS